MLPNVDRKTVQEVNAAKFQFYNENSNRNMKWYTEQVMKPLNQKSAEFEAKFDPKNDYSCIMQSQEDERMKKKKQIELLNF